MKKSIGTKALVAAIGLALMPIAPAYAANWVYVTTNPNKVVFSYDSNTIRRSGNQVTVWEKYDHSRDKTTKKRETKARLRYDCAERTETLLEWIIYYPNGKTDTFAFDTYEQKESSVAPDTVAEDILEAVCGLN
jgi:hypothetical protein